MAGLRRYEFPLELAEAQEKMNVSGKIMDNPFRKKPTDLPRLGLCRAPSPDSYGNGPSFGIPLNHTIFPSSSPPDSPHQMFLENHHQLRKEDLHPHLRGLNLRRGLLFEDIHGAELMSEEAIYKSPEATLLKHLEEISKMKPILEAAGSALQELYCSSDSEFADAWREADRGVTWLERGLTIISQAQKLFRCPTNGNSRTPQE
ncbi:hypothetical protein Pyn_37776 [Prunus yedoensis var. nudiflora]|uniref:Uncharacterized protein n=1 Tax=Prunus yedoensis var. nudiflora TaxID=2094558 RepID=A0A314Z5U3_PRUYE|nr:hypothetical protein Pyn_37776 [Prunus yedoensis var. nudiflora]